MHEHHLHYEGCVCAWFCWWFCQQMYQSVSSAVREQLSAALHFSLLNLGKPVLPGLKLRSLFLPAIKPLTADKQVVPYQTYCFTFLTVFFRTLISTQRYFPRQKIKSIKDCLYFVKNVFTPSFKYLLSYFKMC